MPTKLKSTGVEFPDGSTQTSAASSYEDQDALDLFNATGSAPVYACRAWVYFDGTGTVSINDSGNVSSITDLGTGFYRVNMSTALPDTNYAVVTGARPPSGFFVWLGIENNSPSKTTSLIDVTGMKFDNNVTEIEDGYVAIFR